VSPGPVPLLFAVVGVGPFVIVVHLPIHHHPSLAIIVHSLLLMPQSPPSHCSPLSPHEQLLTAMVGGAVVVAVMVLLTIK
jgi:hypothetical protein